MQILLQLLVDGFVLGSAYSLVALGYATIFSTTRNFHYVHGGVLVVGTFIFYTMTAIWEAPFLLSVIISMAIAFGLGVVINQLLYEPLLKKGAPMLSLFIVSLGLYLVIENSLTMVFGTRARGLEGTADVLSRNANQIGGVYITPIQILIVVVSWVLLISLYLFFTRTRMGTAVRAVANDPDVAEVVGIEVKKVRHLTFGVGSALAAIAGILMALDLRAVDPYLGPSILFIAVVSSILGGFGNVPAAAAGGMMVGIIQNLGAWQFTGEWQRTVLFAVLLVVMLIKPEGMFGQKVSAFREG